MTRARLASAPMRPPRPPQSHALAASFPNNSRIPPLNLQSSMRIALPPMRRSRLLAAVLLALAPAVSATARDGREPEVRPATARPERVLSREELAGNCAGLTVILKTRIDRLRELQKQAKK